MLDLASFGGVADTLDKALDLLANCQRAYLAAPGHLRRQWNQALFERLVVCDERIADAEVAEPFATLADPELPKRLDGEAVTQNTASSGGGSNEALLIGETGFEPATARPPAECATRLRHSPWVAYILTNPRGGSSTVEPQPSKLMTRVRLPSAALFRGLAPMWTHRPQKRHGEHRLIFEWQMRTADARMRPMLETARALWRQYISFGAVPVTALLLVSLLSTASAVSSPLRASFHDCGDIPALATWDVRAKRVECGKAKQVARAYVAAVGRNGGFAQDVIGFHCKISGYCLLYTSPSPRDS